jgi:hypothetical protein
VCDLKIAVLISETAAENTFEYKPITRPSKLSSAAFKVLSTESVGNLAGVLGIDSPVREFGKATASRSSIKIPRKLAALELPTDERIRCELLSHCPLKLRFVL